MALGSSGRLENRLGFLKIGEGSEMKKERQRKTKRGKDVRGERGRAVGGRQHRLPVGEAKGSHGTVDTCVSLGMTQRPVLSQVSVHLAKELSLHLRLAGRGCSAWPDS